MNPALRAVLLTPPFTPARLFRGGEQGWWYELASNFEGLYQDSTGVTPVTAVELPVGLQLDKRYGLVRGSELVTNGGLNSDTGWTKGAGWAISGGTAVATASSANLSQALAVTANKSYEISFTTTYTGGTLLVRLGGAIATYYSQAGTYRGIAVCGSGNQLIEFVGTGLTATIDNISVREIPGNHRIQATAASRPTLSARINILLATATLATQSVTTIAASYKLSFTGTGTVTLSGTSTAGPLVGTGANDRVSLTFTPTAGSLTLTVTGSVTLADLRLSADATSTTPIYQRVTTATDYETSGFRLFLRYDGVDDSLATASTVDFTATDKVTVFAGVTKLSDTARGMLMELSAVYTNPGTFALTAPDAASASYGLHLTGTTTLGVELASGYVSPRTDILCAAYDLSGTTAATEAAIRVNGAAVSPTYTAAGGSGNFGNYTAYFGRRGGSSLPFNGREYSNICVGKAATEREILNAERWINIRTGAYA